MEELLVIGVLAVLTIAAATTLGPKFGVASPLILVVVGILVSLLPFVPAVTIEPEWVLAGVLPPLLYSASVSMPSMNFRREFGAIGGLSVLLVIVSSVLLGLFFAWAIPGLGLGWGVALGAIVSPTDAVATGIVKRAASRRGSSRSSRGRASSTTPRRSCCCARRWRRPLSRRSPSARSRCRSSTRW